MRVLAVVPIQALDRAKSRLAPTLDAAARRALVLQLAERTVRRLHSLDAVETVTVVTPDSAVAAAAVEWGAQPLLQDEPGLDRAIHLAQRFAAARRYPALLVVLGDLPFLEAPVVRHALALLEPNGAVLAPDRHGTGTNLLALSPPDLPIPAFGPGSRRRHRVAAARAGCTLREVWAVSLALDLDTPDDLTVLATWTRSEGGTWWSQLEQ